MACGRRGIFTCIFVWFFVVGLAILIFYLVVKPRNPVFSVDHGSIVSYNLSENHLTNAFDLTLTAYNPNKKMSVVYSSIYIDVHLQDGPLISTSTLVVRQPLVQHVGDSTVLSVYSEANDMVIDPVDVSQLRAENAAGDVYLDMFVTATFWFKLGIVKARVQHLKGNCSPVVLHLSKGKEFQSTHCRVKVHNYRYRSYGYSNAPGSQF